MVSPKSNSRSVKKERLVRREGFLLRVSALILLLAGLLILATPRAGAIIVEKAQLRGEELRVEGIAVTADSVVTVTVESALMASGRADGAGDFRVEALVDTATLSGCNATVSDQGGKIQGSVERK